MTGGELNTYGYGIYSYEDSVIDITGGTIMNNSDVGIDSKGFLKMAEPADKNTINIPLFQYSLYQKLKAH